MSAEIPANWGKNKNLTAILLFVLTSPVGYVLFGLINKHQTLVISAGVVNMCVLIGTTLVGVIVFREGLSPRQIIGMGFALLAIFLIR